MAELTVVTFNPAWGLPSTGPFALKLLKWLDLAGLPYAQRHEENPARGPKGKNPWIELDGERIGDTEAIIEMLARRSGFDIDAGRDAAALARNHAVRRMLEEHFHQVLEWELFVHPEGAAQIRRMAEATGVPAFASGLAAAYFCRHFRRQLHARGIARHRPDVIAAKGIADLDAVTVLLGDRPYLGGDSPSMADVTAFGLLAPMAKWPMHTPVADNLKARPMLMSYIDRMMGARGEEASTLAGRLS